MCYEYLPHNLLASKQEEAKPKVIHVPQLSKNHCYLSTEPVIDAIHVSDLWLSKTFTATTPDTK